MGGQNIFMSGAAHPITEAAMVKKGLLIPAPAGFDVPAGVKTISPTLDQQIPQQAEVKTMWPAVIQ